MSIDTNKLLAQTTQLNELAEKAVQRLAAAEDAIALTNTCLPAYVALPCGVQFGWDWCADKWRLVHINRNGDVAPVKDAGRIGRIEAAAHIEQLIIEIERVTDRWIAFQTEKLK